MTRSKSWIARAALVGVLATTAALQPARGGTGDAALDSLIAERLALIADEVALLPDASTPVLRESAALMDLARDLSPSEVRFARSAVDLALRLGERDRAIDALTAIRKLDPGDQVAMIQYVDLVTSRMESAEQKVAYLKQIIDARGVAAEVQSYAATKLMDLYFARAEDAEANSALDLALKLNPQNLDALRARYRIAAASGVDRDRVKALADILRASPADADTMNALAHEADAVGSYENSGLLRILAINIINSRGQSPSADEAINFMGTQLLAGNDNSVGQMLAQLLQALKEDGRIYTLGLIYEQMHDRPEDAQKENVEMSRGVYLAQLAGVSQLLNEPDKKEMPATRPAVPMPDVRADVAKLKASDPQNLSIAYAVALTEQLWFDLYFRAAEVDDANINALAQLLGEDDPIIVRLQGFKLLQAGKVEEARIKLEAAGDRDGFAKLGVVLADRIAGNVDKAREELTQMIRGRPNGMIAAYLAQVAKSMQVVADQTAREQEISDIITSARAFATDVVSNPRAYYLLTAQPSQVSYALGEPMLANITILNNGHVPITIGPGGMIDPNFVIDAQVRTTPPQGFPATARGKFTGAIRLKPSQKLTTTVRIDRAQLFAFLKTYPTPLFPLIGYVITNAVSDGPTSFKAGAGGQQTKLGQAFERQSSPLYVEEFRKKAVNQLSSGNARERTAMAELFGYMVPALKANTDNAEAVGLATTLSDALSAQLEKETHPEIRAWMQLSYREGLSDEKWVMKLAKSQTILGEVGAMLAARVMPREVRQKVAKAVLESQPQPEIVEFANALAVQPDIKRPADASEGDSATSPTDSSGTTPGN